MASVSSTLQGFLFACVHSGLTITTLTSYWPECEATTPFFARLVLFDFVCSFLLGMALSEHLYSRVEKGGLQGEITFVREGATGVFFAVALFLSICVFIIALSRETTLFVPALLACMYVFTTAASRKEIHERSIFTTPIIFSFVFFAALTMTSQWPFIDDIALMLSNIIWSSNTGTSHLDLSYLGRTEGNVFREPVFPALLMSFVGVSTVLNV